MLAGCESVACRVGKGKLSDGGGGLDLGQAAVCGRRKAYSHHISELHSGHGFCLVASVSCPGAGHPAPSGLQMLRLWAGRLEKALAFIL